MKVAIVHDDLVQWGGAERVLLGLTEIYPEAPIYTSVYNRHHSILRKQFAGKKVITSFLQEIPGWQVLYKALLPVYGLAFEQFNFDNYDLVISSTTRFAKAIITKPHTLHICYCHTPPRFLWNFSGSRSNKLLNFILSELKSYDAITAYRPDYFIAGSRNAQCRIKKVYGLTSTVVYPFVDLGRFDNVDSFNGGYFVVAGRLNQYKRTDLAVKACLKTGQELKIIGNGPEFATLANLCNDKPLDYSALRKKPSIQLLGQLDEEMLVSVLAGCRALIIPGIEDFGLTSLEAQALGKPVIALSSGGALETVVNNTTGVLFDTQSVDSLGQAINKLDLLNINPDACKQNARKFGKEKFISSFKQTVDALL